MADRIDIAFACNDPCNGRFAGSFTAVEFSEPGGECIVGLIGEAGIEIGGRLLTILEPNDSENPERKFIDVPTQGRRSWEGNWCWETFTVDEWEARRVLRWLVGHGFSIEELQLFDSPIDDLLRELEAVA